MGFSFFKRNHYSEESLDNLKKISMLHKDTLRMMHKWSQSSEQNVLEIGSYIGGGTIALASGTRRKVIAIEVGGKSDHDMIPSDNILKDLRKNLSRWSVQNVEIIAEDSESPMALEKLEKILNGEKISLVVLDSNGSIISELERYKHFLSPGCRIIIDDYTIEDSKSHGKNFLVYGQVNQMIREGLIVKDSINGWGTFFGSLSSEYFVAK